MTAPVVPRELSITYGGQTVGGTSDYPIDAPEGLSKWKLDRVYGHVSIVFVFRVTETVENTFATVCSALEAAFKTPRQRIRVFVNSTTLEDFDPAQNTGFNARSRIRKLGGEGDTVRSRFYEVSIDVETPADLAGQSGRLDGSYNLDTEPGGRRRLTFAGVYRALGSNSARTQFGASIATYTGLISTAIGGTWELVGTPVAESDDTDKNLRYVRVLREILLNQSVSTLDDADIVDAELVVARVRSAPGDTQFGTRAVRLQEVRVRYSAWILASGGSMKDKWENVIRPWLLTHAASVWGVASPIVVDEDPGIDASNRRIEATIRMVALNGSNLLAFLVTTQDREDKGILPVGVWSGDPFAMHLFRGPAKRVRTVTRVVRRVASAGSGASGSVASVAGNSLADDVAASLAPELGSFGISAVGDVTLDTGSAAGGGVVPAPAGAVGGSKSGYVLTGVDVQRTPLTIGFVDGSLDVIDETSVLVFIYRRAP